MTTTDWVAWAMGIGMCSTGLVPEASVMVWETGCEAGGSNFEVVDTDGSLGHFELAAGVCGGTQGEGGVDGLEGDLSTGNGPVLDVVNDTVDGSKDGGQRWDGGCPKQCNG